MPLAAFPVLRSITPVILSTTGAGLASYGLWFCPEQSSISTSVTIRIANMRRFF